MPHTLPVPLTESPRRTPEEARTALLAIAKRSPWIIDPETVDMLLSNVSHVGAMLCALGSNYSTPGCDDFDFVQVLLGHLAGVYFEAGKRSAFDQVIAVESREPTNPVSAPIERLSHDKAKAALLAVAARPQRVLVPNDVDRLLGEGEIVDMFAFAVNVSAEDPTNTTPFVRTLLGYLAHLHYEAGRANMGPARFFDLATALRDVFVRMEAAVAHDATMTGVGNVQRSWEALKTEMLRQEQINAPVRSEGQRWDEGGGDPIRDIKTATAPIEARCGARHCHDTGYWKVVCTCTRDPGHVADYHEDASVPVRWSAVAVESTPPVTAPTAAPVEKKAQR